VSLNKNSQKEIDVPSITHLKIIVQVGTLDMTHGWIGVGDGIDGLRCGDGTPSHPFFGMIVGVIEIQEEFTFMMMGKETLSN
jgi:hypothetical protein